MQDKPLEIEKIDDASGATILRIHGPLLLGNFFPVQTMVRADGADLLILDLSDMPYIDSAGIGCLVGAHISREGSGRKLVLVGVNERLDNLAEGDQGRPTLHHRADGAGRAGQSQSQLTVRPAMAVRTSDTLSR